MPLYEYSCTECGKQFELIRALAERDLPCQCPHCGQQADMQRLSSLVSSLSGSTGGEPGSSCGPSGSSFG
jgi:putative FmdB family regulatory protein